MIAWDDYRLFLLSCRSGSLSAAARRAGLDKSTLSRRIAKLESLLGMRLVIRTRDGLRPTAAGTRLLDRLEPLANELDQIDAHSLEKSGEISGLVRVALTEGLAPFIVETCAVPLMERHPDLALELIAGNAPLDLLRGDADLAIRLVEPKQAALRCTKLGELTIGLYGSTAYFSARGRPETAGELRGHDALMPAGDLANLPEAKWLAARRGLRVVMRANTLSALAQAALLDRGLVPLADAWALRFEGKLQRAMAIPGITPRAVWLVLRPEVADKKPVRVVADAIRSLFRAAL